VFAYGVLFVSPAPFNRSARIFFLKVLSTFSLRVFPVFFWALEVLVRALPPSFFPRLLYLFFFDRFPFRSCDHVTRPVLADRHPVMFPPPPRQCEPFPSALNSPMSSNGSTFSSRFLDQEVFFFPLLVRNGTPW